MIELNADIGEGCDDASLLPYLQRVSIACGGHYGDAHSMRAALSLAAEHDVVVGAHPSYPDRANFGRHTMAACATQITGWVTQQTEVLSVHASQLGMRLSHVKPHGALYNDAAVNPVIAEAIARAVAAFDPALVLVCPADSALIAAGRAAGLSVMNEVFADRRYHADGRLVSRETAGAVVKDPIMAVRQACAFAQSLPIKTIEGGSLQLNAETLCLHGDTPDAHKMAAAIHAALYPV